MQADFGWGDQSPRFALNTLWFLAGVIVFAFSVLAMASIVAGRDEGSPYLDVAPQQQEQTLKPAASQDVAPPLKTNNSSRVTP